MSLQSERQRFEYGKLSSPRSIRLLILHSAASSTAPIVCSLKEVSLDECPSYKALSYTWDNQELCCSIDCSGFVLYTTPNCLAALRQLRQTQVLEVLWVDSLCIDQTSISERSQQVALMGEIYKEADTVIAWIGDNDQAIEIAMERLKELMAPAGLGEAKDLSIIQERARKLCEDVNKESEDLIGPLFQSSWFYRLWTTQEVSLALRENVEVRCGGSTIEWLLLMDASVALENYPWPPIRKALALQVYLCSWIRLHQIPDSELLQPCRPEKSTTPSVSYILTRGRDKACSDPKDKIFALLSVLNALGLNSMSPDYSRSVEEIYWEAAQLAIESDKNLNILFKVSSPNRRSGLLSWVPDWNDSEFCDTDGRGQVGTRFCAAERADPVWSFSADHQHLNLSGRLLDKVICRAEKLLYSDDDLFERGNYQKLGRDDDGTWIINEPLRAFHATLPVLKSWVNISKRYAGYPTGESVRVALHHILIHDARIESQTAQSKEEFDRWYELMQASDVELFAVALECQGDSEDFIRRHMGILPEEYRTLFALRNLDVWEYHWDVAVMSNNKCLFTTENGYMGAGPEMIRPGDRVAVIAGVCMPLILRPKEYGHELVTHAYVHGITCGEARPEDEEDLEEITLV